MDLSEHSLSADKEVCSLAIDGLEHSQAIAETKHSTDAREPSERNILQHSILIQSVASILLSVFIVLFPTDLFAFSLILFS